jgi:predicted exporter
MNGRGWVLLAAWCVLLALGVIWVQQRLVVSADLRLFMPEPRTEEQSCWCRTSARAPASRLLLVAIGGDEPRHWPASRTNSRPHCAVVPNSASSPMARRPDSRS